MTDLNVSDLVLGATKKRVLIIAYEFPPSPSPQSLRWKFLASELSARGMDVHVLTVDQQVSANPLDVPIGVTIHRTFPGLVTGGIRLLARCRRALRGVAAERSSYGSDSGMTVAPSVPASHLNWKGRLVESIQRWAGGWYFPDIRGEWLLFARYRLRHLLRELRPHVVVSSHEPATTLQLGGGAKASGYPWLVDLGDPVLSCYTPKHWSAKALLVERQACRGADRVTVTTLGAKSLLDKRHGLPEGRVQVLTQGFDAEVGHADSVVSFDPSRLELLFTGSFYSFRRPEVLLEAVIRFPSVRLNVATSRWPEHLRPLLIEYPDQIRLLGFLPHSQAVAVQRRADVLVNIANDDPVHVPGKVFEYLGARRPILQLGGNMEDAAAVLIKERGCGLHCTERVDAVVSVLSKLFDLKQEGRLDSAFNLRAEGLDAYTWQEVGKRLYDMLTDICGGRR